MTAPVVIIARPGDPNPGIQAARAARRQPTYKRSHTAKLPDGRRARLHRPANGGQSSLWSTQGVTLRLNETTDVPMWRASRDGVALTDKAGERIEAARLGQLIADLIDAGHLTQEAAR